MHPALIDFIKIKFHPNVFSLSYRLFGGIFIRTTRLFTTYIPQKIPIIKYIVP